MCTQTHFADMVASYTHDSVMDWSAIYDFGISWSYTLVNIHDVDRMIPYNNFIVNLLPVNTYVEDNVGISVEEFSIIFFWPRSNDEFLKYERKIRRHHQMKILNNRLTFIILMDLSIHIDTLSMEFCIFFIFRGFWSKSAIK